MDFDCSWDIMGYILVLTRLIIGYRPPHAGMTKIIDESFNTAGYLANAPAALPFQGFFVWATATPWFLDLTDVMVPWGKSLIGLRFIVGVFIRLAAFFSGVLMVLFYPGNAEQSHDMVNGGLFGLMMFVIVGMLAVGRILGLDAIIGKVEFTRQRPTLRYLLG